MRSGIITGEGCVVLEIVVLFKGFELLAVIVVGIVEALLMEDTSF